MTTLVVMLVVIVLLIGACAVLACWVLQAQLIEEGEAHGSRAQRRVRDVRQRVLDRDGDRVAVDTRLIDGPFVVLIGVLMALPMLAAVFGGS